MACRNAGRTSYTLTTPPGSPSLSPEMSPRRKSESASKRVLVRLPPVAEERSSSVDHHSSGAADPSSTDSDMGSLSPSLVSAATAERLVSIAARFEQVIFVAMHSRSSTVRACGVITDLPHLSSIAQAYLPVSLKQSLHIAGREGAHHREDPDHWSQLSSPLCHKDYPSSVARDPARHPARNSQPGSRAATLESTPSLS